MSIIRPFKPAGPVSAAFIASRKRVTAIMGPIGGGKTSAAVMKAIYIAREQAPDPDGVRRTRFAFVRKTYRDLERTLLKTWCEWIPPDFGEGLKGGSGGQPAHHLLRFRMPDNTVVETEVLFLAIGENSAEEALRGLEVTGFFLDEADTLDEEVLHYADTRVGRYPKTDPDNGFPGPTWRGVWCALNAPDTDNWIYRTFVESLPEEWAFFRQPGGLEQGAENLEHMDGGAEGYRRMMVGKPDWFVRRMIHNQFGYSRDGMPVFPEFRESLHIAPSIIRPVRGLVIRVAVDAGRTPAAVFQQPMPNGQLRRIAELVTTGMGATNFGRYLRRFADSEFQGFKFEGWGDPAAGYAARDDADERNWLEIVSHETKIQFRPAPTNSAALRLEAIRHGLTELIDGEPASLYSPACKVLIKGYLSGYRYRRMLVGGTARYADQPEKNDFSHVCDADQYGELGGGGHMEALGRSKSRFSSSFQAATDFTVLGGR